MMAQPNKKQSRPIVSPGTLAWAGLLLSAGLAFSFSCRLESQTEVHPASTLSAPSVGGHLLSAAQIAFSEYFREKAEEVFHGGVQDRHDKAFTNLVFQTLGTHISPERHVHLDGSKSAQMTPWLWFSLKADAHNVQSYLIAAHWLGSRAGLQQADKAMEVLTQGIMDNPRHFRLHSEVALLHLKAGRLPESRQAFDGSLRLWPSQEDPTSESARLAKEVMLTYRALLFENDKDIPNAIALWKQVLQLFPDRTDVLRRVAFLSQGGQPPILASDQWKALIRNGENQSPACHRSDSVEDDHNEPHSPDHQH
jgi:tetratricopeptide (TPR) repeat protein